MSAEAGLHWSSWKNFPTLDDWRKLDAPAGPGVYELRIRGTETYVLCGIGGQCAKRMLSLLPKPHGVGTRKNMEKRQFVFDRLSHIEYRTLACATREQAREVEKELLATKRYLYPT